MPLKSLQNSLRQISDPKIAEHSERFFKTGKGEYGEGDIFLGIRVPVLRQQVKKYRDIKISDVKKLIQSKYHEERLCALLLLVDKFSKGTDQEKENIFNFYIKSTQYINNWDLVDCSAHLIAGAFLENRDKEILYKLAKSANLWERRIAVITTFYMIKKNRFTDTLKICEILLDDKEDLIHKATGWMLREIGKRDVVQEKRFLNKYYRKMPRTMLRYAIEKFPEEERQKYLKGQI